jgi:hypothetical protein
VGAVGSARPEAGPGAARGPALVRLDRSLGFHETHSS